MIERLQDFFWYDRVSCYHNYKEQIQRMWFWARKMRRNYDFDALFIYDMLYDKLDRVYDTMENHGHCVWNSNVNNPDMRRLSEARILAKRLSQDRYNTNTDRFYCMYRRKSGGAVGDFFYDLYPNAKTLENEKLYNYMFKKSYENDNKLKKIEKDRLFHLLNTYIEHWWD